MPRGQPTIPSAPGELTAPWLTEVLRQAGVLGRARVVDHQVETPGAGIGFIGETVRVHLTYDRPAPDAPDSLVAKFPTPVAANRGMAEMDGTYEREIWFYRTFADQVPVRLPRLYHGDFDPAPPYAVTKTAHRVINNLPNRVMDAFVGRVNDLMRPSKRRFVLLIEWIDGATVHSIADVPPDEEIRATLAELACLHAAFWTDHRLAEVSDEHFRPVASPVPRSLARAYLRVRDETFEALHDLVRARVAALLDHTNDHISRVVARLNRAPYTLVHGDPRFDNWLFRPGERPVLIDWGLPTRARAGWDVGYLLSAALEGDDARDRLEHYVGYYLAELRSHGVAADHQQVRDDVDLTLCFLGHRNVLARLAFRADLREGGDLSNLWLHRLIDVLPERHPRI